MGSFLHISALLPLTRYQWALMRTSPEECFKRVVEDLASWEGLDND